MNEASPEFEAGFQRGFQVASSLRTDIVMGVGTIALLAGMALGWWLL